MEELRMEINKKILNFDAKTELNVILVHHYFLREFKRIGVNSKSITFRELEKEIGISVQKIRTALDKLEEAGIIEVINDFNSFCIFLSNIRFYFCYLF